VTRSDRLLGSSWRRFATGRSRAVIAEARHRSVPAGCCQFQVSASTPLYHLTRIHPATISYEALQHRRIAPATTPRLRLSLLPPLFHHRHHICSSTTGTTIARPQPVPTWPPSRHQLCSEFAVYPSPDEGAEFRLASAPGLAPTPKASIQPTPAR
jgi:hypothetical protein